MGNFCCTLHLFLCMSVCVAVISFVYYCMTSLHHRIDVLISLFFEAGASTSHYFIITVCVCSSHQIVTSQHYCIVFRVCSSISFNCNSLIVKHRCEQCLAVCVYVSQLSVYIVCTFHPMHLHILDWGFERFLPDFDGCLTDF